ncbi:hypothetical protein ACJX0J_016750, partial [Zea mays]
TLLVCYYLFQKDWLSVWSHDREIGFRRPNAEIQLRLKEKGNVDNILEPNGTFWSSRGLIEAKGLIEHKIHVSMTYGQEHPIYGEIFVKKEQRMTKDETLLVFTLVVSSVSIFLFGILLFMVLISATRDFRERTKSKLVKIMIWAGIVVITFAIAVRIYPIFIFLLKERIKPLVEALYDKLP